MHVFNLQGDTWGETARITDDTELTRPSQFANNVRIFDGAVLTRSATNGVKVFTRRNESQWELAGELIDDRDFNVYFTFEAGTLVVGHPRETTQWAGRVRIFHVDDPGLTEEQTFYPLPNEDDRFGASLGGSPDLALVGVPGDFAVTEEDAGSVRVIRRQGLEWTSEAVLVASDPRESAALGTSVSYREDLIASGAPGAYGVAQSTGAVYLFAHDTGDAWVEEDKLFAIEGQTGDAFGSSVVVQGPTAVIGALGHGDSGGAYVFVERDGYWLEDSRLVFSGATEGARLGASLTRDGDAVAVGAPGDRESGVDAGAVFVLVDDDMTTPVGFSPGEKILPSDGADGYQFGASVSLTGRYLFVGAPGAPGGLSGLEPEAGAVYVFERSATSWTEIQRIVADDGQPGDHFGASLSFRGTSGIVGAPSAAVEDDGVGAVSSFELAAIWAFRDKFLSPDAGDEFGNTVYMADEDVALVGTNRSLADRAFGTAFVLQTGSVPDCNSNGVSDFCDVVEQDCNENGVPDDCDVSAGDAEDANANLVPDDCERFRRGDHNGDGLTDLTDGKNILEWLLLGQHAGTCDDASDFDNSGAIDITDTLVLLQWLFLGGVTVPPPGATTCGFDTTGIFGIDLGCFRYPDRDFLPDAACPQ